jgi:hypothetical protein
MAEQGIELDASRFQLAKHNGIIRVHNPKTSVTQVLSIVTAKGGGMMGRRLVKVLIGPDPEVWQSWATFGYVIDERVQVWARWKTRTYLAYGKLLERPAWYAQHRGLTYRVEAWCRRCNAPLREEASLEQGLEGFCVSYASELKGGSDGG